jgi:hypothetical protein
MSEFKKRLLYFLKVHVKKGQTRFEEYCGLTRGSINNTKKGMSDTSIAKIAEKYPELNLEWLITGKGEMLNASENSKKNINIGDSASEIIVGGAANKIAHYHNSSKDEIIAEKDKYIEHLIKEAFNRNKEKDEELKRMREQMAKQQEVIAKLLNMLEKQSK